MQATGNRKQTTHIMHPEGVIPNCNFEFRCPKQWSSLQAKDNDNERFCKACQRNVYLCKSIKELNQHIDKGHCVAVKTTSLKMTMGLLKYPGE